MTTSEQTIRQLMEELIPFNRHLGVRLAALRPGFARLELPFREEFVGNPLSRVLHGGVISALIDNCGGAAVWSQIEEGDLVATVDLRVDYLRPTPSRDVACEGVVQRLGNRVGVAEMRLFTIADPGTLLATGKGVYNVRRAEG